MHFHNGRGWLADRLLHALLVVNDNTLANANVNFFESFLRTLDGKGDTDYQRSSGSGNRSRRYVRSVRSNELQCMVLAVLEETFAVNLVKSRTD